MKQVIAQFLANLAATAPHQSKCDMPGGITLEDDLETLAGYGCTEEDDEIQPGDLGIYVDYADDGLPPGEADELAAWYYDRVWDEIHKFMASLGYHEIGEPQDGSGGGLYYGGSVFRK